MVKIPGAESVQRVGVQRDPGVRAGGPSPGEIQAQGVLDFGDAAYRAGVRIQNRNDAIALSNAVSTANQQWADQLRLMEEENKLTDPQAVEQFGTQLKEQQAELLNSAGVVLGDNRSRLTTRLESLRGEYASRAAGMAVQAQRKKLNDEMAQTVSRTAASVYDAPETTEDAIASLEASIDDVAGALTPAQERAARVAGRSQIHMNAIQGLIDRGALEEAENRLTDPGVSEFLGPDDTRRLRSRITVQRVEEERADTAIMREMAQMERILGRPLTQEEKVRKLGLAPPAGQQSLSQWVAEQEMVLGRPLTDQEIAKKQGFLVEGDPPLSDELQLMYELAPSFSIGTTSPKQDRQLQAAITNYTQEKTFVDRDTGQTVSRRPELPPFMREALRLRQEIETGAQQDPGMAPAQPGQARPQQQSMQGAQPFDEGMLTRGPQMAGMGEQQPQAQPPAPEEQPTTVEGNTFWDLAPLVAGPVPAAATAAEATPVLGSFVDAPQMTQARSEVQTRVRDLVRTLQNNPRYAEGERKQIENEIGLGPAAWDTAEAYRNRLIGVDQALERRLKDATALLSGELGPTTLEERQWALSAIPQITNFRQGMGLPPRPKNKAQYQKWLGEGKIGSGDTIITPDGNLKVVP